TNPWTPRDVFLIYLIKKKVSINMKERNHDTLQNHTPSKIGIEEIGSKDNQPEAANKEDEVGHIVCQVVFRSGKICGKKLKKDKSSSMKTFHGHLLQQNQLGKPNLSKKTQMKQKHFDMRKWCEDLVFFSELCLFQVELNNKTLKKSLIYLVTNCDLPFAFIEKQNIP
ncbi:uncharacterized protein VP01_4481g1, partial [Puccinia sorghi]